MRPVFLQLANNGQIIEKPEDALKSPVILDFLGFDTLTSINEGDSTGAATLRL